MQHNVSARDVALLVLERAGQSLSVQALLDEALSARSLAPVRGKEPANTVLSSQDVALATELVYGYLRSEIRLAWLLGRFLKAPEKLPVSMRIILGMAAYELLHLDRIPARASVHCAVDMVRQRFGLSLSKVANGVLRSITRLQEHKPEEQANAQKALQAESGTAVPVTSRTRAPLDPLGPLDPLDPLDPLELLYTQHIADPLQRLAIAASLPLWMVGLWHKAYGLERARELAQASGCSPWPCVRVNAHHPDAAFLRENLLQQGGKPVGTWGLRFAPGTQPPHLRVLQQQGRLSFQGASSQLVLEALHIATWPTPVWDACAGRGGKTCALLERGMPVLAASDTYWPRLAALPHEVARLGLACPALFVGSAAIPPLPDHVCPTILLDVPCSGLGTLARRPDLRRLRTPEHLTPLVDLQAHILTATWNLLPAGGHLVYLTCTVNPAENEDQIAGFLTNTPSASLLQQYQSQPDATGADLMYGALLRKACGSMPHTCAKK